MSESIWATLSAIDCNDHIEKKGQFSYLAWTWAWAKVKEVYPLSTYALEDDITYPDGTMEVRVTVTISEGPDDVMFHTMWLPVLDFKNKPIQHPNALDINTARMRCLVKCLAMFGLGHYIYAGESAPAASPELQEKYEELLSLVANGKGWDLLAFTDTNQPMMDDLFNMAPDGKKSKFKSDVRAAYSAANGSVKTTAKLLGEIARGENTEYSLQETVDELEPLEREYVWKRMAETDRVLVEEQLSE